MFRIPVIGAGLLLLAACAGKPPVGGPHLTVLPATDLPKPGRAEMSAADVPYYVGPFDRLVIDVFGVPELSEREVQVDAGGRISFPLAGSLEVSGQAPQEIEQALARQLAAQYVRNPQVTVTLKETLSRMITIDGQVKKPGLFPVMGGMTLMRTIATAEGTLDYADLEDVVVFRTVGGRDYAALYNLGAIRRGAYPDPAVYAGDVVMVGESSGRRMFKDVLSVMPALITPLVIGLDRLTR